MFTLEEMSEFEYGEENTSGGGEQVKEYLETYDSSMQSKTPYSDVTKVRKNISTKNILVRIYQWEYETYVDILLFLQSISTKV